MAGLPKKNKSLKASVFFFKVNVQEKNYGVLRFPFMADYIFYGFFLHTGTMGVAQLFQPPNEAHTFLEP